MRYHHSRPYGWFGLADVDGDGRMELITIGDFQSHIDVLDFDPKKPESERLSARWHRGRACSPGLSPIMLGFAVKNPIPAHKPLAAMNSLPAFLRALAVLVLATSAFAQQTTVLLENRALRSELDSSSGAITLLDKQTGVSWELGPPAATLKSGGAATLPPLRLTHRDKSTLRYRCEGIGEFSLRLLAHPPRLEYSVVPEPEVKDLRLLSKALPVAPGENSYYAAPHRMGILLRAEGDKPYNRRFRDSCSMAMFGAVKEGSALLVTWTDPYTEVQVDYSAQPAPQLRMGLAMRERAQSVRLQPLGRGGYVEIAKAYRAVARERGLLKTLAEKMRENPRVAELFGAADFKPFAYMRLAPNTPWHRQDTWGAQLNFTFEECANLAEHLNRDLGINRAMLVLNGWINGGYDNRHPDILPAAPEIGGNDGLAACSRRVKALGWLFGLHDNYQDMYRYAPSWNEEFIIKNTYEVLSPLNRLTALMPMTDHRFLTANRKAERTRFGKDVEITVNYDTADLVLKNAVLPQYGFVVESPTLLAFHARSYGAMKFTQPTMLVLRSADGKNLNSSRNIQMYSAFGDCPAQWNGRAVTSKP